MTLLASSNIPEHFVVDRCCSERFGSRIDSGAVNALVSRVGQLENEQGGVAPRVGSLEQHIAALDGRTVESENVLARRHVLFDGQTAWTEPGPAQPACSPASAGLPPAAPPGIQIEAATVARGAIHQITCVAD